MRLRADDVELPDGTVVENYYVRESSGFTVVFALTPDNDVVLVRQYRYGSDAIHLEPVAGMIDDGEEPLDCAKRELLEETGYAAERFEAITAFYAEPVRSSARAYVYAAFGARKVAEARPDPTESMEVELTPLSSLHGLLAGNAIDTAGMIAAGYRFLEYVRSRGEAG